MCGINANHPKRISVFMNIPLSYSFVFRLFVSWLTSLRTSVKLVSIKIPSSIFISQTFSNVHHLSRSCNLELHSTSSSRYLNLNQHQPRMHHGNGRTTSEPRLQSPQRFTLLVISSRSSKQLHASKSSHWRYKYASRDLHPTPSGTIRKLIRTTRKTKSLSQSHTISTLWALATPSPSIAT